MTYESAKDLVENHKKLNPAQTVQDIGNVLAGSLMATGGIHELKKSPIKQPTTTGEPNAEGIRSNQGQPSQTGTIPQGVKNGSGQDLQQPPPRPPQPVEQGAQGNAPPHVNDARQQASGVLSPIDQIKSVDSFYGNDIIKAFSGTKGSLTGRAYELGLSLSKPEELEALQTAGQKASDEFKQTRDARNSETDPEKKKAMLQDMAALASKSQFFREAYEVATGTGSGGEEMLRRDPSFKPPLPIKETPLLKPNELKPALLVKGRPMVGGNNHNQIMLNAPLDLKADAIEALGDDANHVFIDQNGKIYNRDEGAKAIGRKGLLNAEDLPKQKTTGKVVSKFIEPQSAKEPTVAAPAQKNMPAAAEPKLESITPLDPQTGNPVQKFRVGNSPQLHSLVEKLPQSEVEKSNGEQPVRVRNDTTGKESVVLQSDLTPVSAKPLADKAAQQAKAQDLDRQLRAAKLEPGVFKNRG